MQNEALHRVREQLLLRHVGGAIVEMRSFLAVYQHDDIAVGLDAVVADYELMSGYWQQGYRDPQLPENYERLLHRLYQLYVRAERAEFFKKSAFLSGIRNRIYFYKSQRDWSPSFIRSELETFVSELAMADLEPPHIAKERRTFLYADHQHRMNDLFDFLWTSDVWTDQTGEAFEQMLLTPTIDSRDQQLMLSAIMLSALNAFDMAKLRLLAHVYRQSQDEYVRQRALVALALAADVDVAAVFPEQQQLISELLDDEDMRREVVELQMQLLYCINAEQDHEKIRNEIMPDLLKNNNLRITRNGLEEQEDDPMEDILHPEESELRIERLEESFHKIVDMQRQGADIYFGGFSQMKRFPFFQEASNWFVPFYFEHPGIADALDSQHGEVFLRKMMTKGTFCNSDKYSFVLAFKQVISHLPQSLREMFDRGEVSMEEIEMETETLQSPAFIRRFYLQDIYRFFRVFHQASHLVNPFDRQDEKLKRVLFLNSDIFTHAALGKQLVGVASLLMKQQRADLAVELLRRVGAEHQGFQYMMLMGNALSRLRRNSEDSQQAYQCYLKAAELKPQNERAHQALARECFLRGEYEDAEARYDTLITLNPDKRSYRLNKAVCMINRKQAAEALPLLYQLSLDDADDVKVNGVLAWALTIVGKYDRAEVLYEQLTDANPNDESPSALDAQPSPDNLLNYGYCLWFMGKNEEAVKYFKRYVAITEQQALSVIDNEKELLEQKGITEPEMLLMLDMIS